jgi:hypothetical protein
VGKRKSAHHSEAKKATTSGPHGQNIRTYSGFGCTSINQHRFFTAPGNNNRKRISLTRRQPDLHALVAAAQRFCLVERLRIATLNREAMQRIHEETPPPYQGIPKIWQGSTERGTERAAPAFPFTSALTAPLRKAEVARLPCSIHDISLLEA